MKLMFKTFAATVLCIGALAVQAAEFTVFIYEAPHQLAKRTSATDAESYWATYNQFAGTLAQAGVLRGDTALGEAPSAHVRGKGGSSKAVRGARLGGIL